MEQLTDTEIQERSALIIESVKGLSTLQAIGVLEVVKLTLFTKASTK